MKRFEWHWLAACSLLLASIAAAEVRPQYGGTLRIAIHEAPSSLDPADTSQEDSTARRNLLSLIFETLITVDDRGRVHASLATTWQSSPGNQRWQFQIRRGVKFHDGSALSADIAASVLRTANPSWKVFAEGDSVIIERDHEDDDVPAELALARNSVAKKNGGGKISGTGPFHIEDWQPGKHLTLGVEENHWRGRAFVDKIDIEIGRNFHEQIIELDSGKIDVAETAPEQAHHAIVEGHLISSSQPVELVALLFTTEAQTQEEKLARSVLSHSIERSSMQSVLLQGAGKPAGSLLPNWITGYAFVFSTNADFKEAHKIREQLRAQPSWTMGYDANDSLQRSLAERIALNARDAGLALKPVASTNAEIRLARIPLTSADPWVALNDMAVTLGIKVSYAVQRREDSIEDLYFAERTMLSGLRVIPLFHLPVNWVMSSAVKNWRLSADGDWHLDEVWIGKEK
jgi:peptide/nickel transport system substrate-binding protein